jgi:hypothetical protein
MKMIVGSSIEEMAAYIVYFSNCKIIMIKAAYTFFVTISLASTFFACTGCHSAYKATATGKQVQKSLCAEEWLLFPDQPHPMFEEIPAAIADAPADIPLPQKYTRYKVAGDTLGALFNRLRTTNNKTGIILPINNHCEPFELVVSGTMSQELQSKYPELVAVQGHGVNNKAADVRLEWNGKQMRGQVTYNGTIYLIAGITDNNITTYLVYNKADTGETKKPFEETPNKKQSDKVYYDR